jgi:stage V sporulation protein SpoVS
MQTAKAIAAMIHKHNCAEVQAIGRPAVHYAMKGITQAVAYFKEQGIQLGFTATYIEPGADGDNEKEGFRFLIEPFTPLISPEESEDRTVKINF